MKKPVLLVNPGRNKPWASILPPMNLGSIASYLEKHGVETYIIDELAGQEVKKAIQRFQPEIVGITATSALLPDAYRVAKIARKYGALTIMGGAHATNFTEDTLKHVDIVVCGEGEKAMLSIVNGERSRIIKLPYIKCLDEIPPPAWHLMDMEFYLTARDRLGESHIGFVPPHTRIGTIMTSRGCPYNCIFCCNSWREVPVRFNSTDWTINSIKSLIEQYHIQALYFADDDLFMNKKRLKEICGLLIDNKFNLKWGCQTKANTINKESLEIAKEAGCCQVQFGFESGSQRILDILKKKTTTVEQNAKAAKLCKEIGVICFATFMLGNPTETEGDLEATFQFIKEHNIDRVSILITTPFPGTELWKWCEKNDLIPKNIDWAELKTNRVVIPACNTLSAKTIRKYKDKIEGYLYPNRRSNIFIRLYQNPWLVFEAIKHPTRTFKMLYSRVFE